jgi:hypothetical protein
METTQLDTYTDNKIISIEINDNDLPRSLDWESCPGPHLKWKQRTGYAI